jgi:ribonuclease III
VSSAERLQTALAPRFREPDLLRLALTHRSHSAAHNERIEFLGDSVLNCVMAALLYNRFPGLREGDLSRQRANLVRQDTLAEIAQSLRLGEELQLGEGEVKSGGFRRPSILADALEAVFGAIFLDAGFEAARSVIARLYQPWLDQIDPSASGKDAKTELQELLQARHLPLPQYSLQETRGEAHAQEFEVECAVDTLAIRVRGAGNSRRSAEQAAARVAITRILSS